MSDGFDKALEQGREEYLRLFKNGLRTIKKTEDRISACNMVMMRARDIENESKRENAKDRPINVMAYDFTGKKWSCCPICTKPVDQETDGKKWQGCKECGLLLNWDGMIRPMKRWK